LCGQRALDAAALLSEYFLSHCADVVCLLVFLQNKDNIAMCQMYMDSFNQCKQDARMM